MSLRFIFVVRSAHPVQRELGFLKLQFLFSRFECRGGLELMSRGAFEKDPELARSRRLPQLAQHFGFDLPDALA